MNKIDFNKGMGKIKKRVKKDRTESEKEDGSKCRTINKKICPFMSSPDEQVACTSQCRIYREDKGEYGCAFSELTSISWSLSGKKKKRN